MVLKCFVDFQIAHPSIALDLLLFRLQAPKLQKYLWPFGRVRGLYLKTVAGLWSLSASQGVREAAFLFLRNACAVANGMATAKGSDVVQPIFTFCFYLFFFGEGEPNEISIS